VLLLVGAFVATLIAALGWRSGARELLAVGGIGAVICGAGALLFRGARYQMAGFPVHSYGVALCVAIAAGLALAIRLARREGLYAASIAQVFLVAAASGLAGARLLYVLTNVGAFESFAAVFALRRGGFAVFGALGAGTLGAWLYCRRRSIRFRVAADVVAPAAVLAVAIGRIGCYLFGCDFGRPLGPWAPGWLKRLGTFPRWTTEPFSLGTGAPAWMHHVLHRSLPFSSEVSLPVHPTQLYECIGALAIVVGVLLVRRNRRKAGQVAIACLAAYAALRFLLELYRDDPERGLWGPTLPAAWNLAIGAGVFAIALALGPLRSIADPRKRWGAYAIVAVVVPSLYSMCRVSRVPEFEHWKTTAPQWISVLGVIAAAIAWRRLDAGGERAAPGHVVKGVAQSSN
jgi:phosphatidylglycerol:prolipoprotein diacylglycerol transferase